MENVAPIQKVVPKMAPVDPKTVPGPTARRTDRAASKVTPKMGLVAPKVAQKPDPVIEAQKTGRVAHAPTKVRAISGVPKMVHPHLLPVARITDARPLPLLMVPMEPRHLLRRRPPMVPKTDPPRLRPTLLAMADRKAVRLKKFRLRLCNAPTGAPRNSTATVSYRAMSST